MSIIISMKIIRIERNIRYHKLLYYKIILKKIKFILIISTKKKTH